MAKANIAALVDTSQASLDKAKFFKFEKFSPEKIKPRGGGAGGNKDRDKPSKGQGRK